MVIDSVVNCDADLRNEMFGNIVMSDGNAISPGLHGRKKQDIQNIVLSEPLVYGYLSEYEAVNLMTI